MRVGPTLGLVRFGFVLGVSGLVVHAALFSPFDAATLAWFSAAWIAAAPLWILLSRRLPDRVTAAVSLALWLACTVFVGAELGLRATAALFPSPQFAQADPRIERLVESKRWTPGTYYWGFPVNSDGWYDEEFAPRRPDRLRVLSVSDSFAWGAVPHYYHFTTVCERSLAGAEVLNLGWSATGIDTYAHIVEHWSPVLEPDVIVVSLFVGNDLVDMISRKHTGLRRWFDRDGLLLYLVPRRLLAMWREANRRRAEQHDGPVWGAGTQVAVPTEELERVFPWLSDPLREQATFSKTAFQGIEAERAHNLRLRRWPPEFLRRVEGLIAAAGPTPVLFLLIPDQFQVDDQVWADVLERVPDPPARFGPQHILNNWFERRGVPHLDLLPVLRTVPPLEGGGRHLYHLRDTHLNRRGSEAIGLALARALEGFRRE